MDETLACVQSYGTIQDKATVKFGLHGNNQLQEDCDKTLPVQCSGGAAVGSFINAAIKLMKGLD